KYYRLPLQFLKISSELVYFLFQLFPFSSCLALAVINVQISVSFIRWKDSSFHSSSIYTKASYCILPAIFKCTLNFFDSIVNNGFHAIYHDYIIISTFIHIFDMFTAEITAVENKSCVLISVSFGFITHALKL